MKCLDAFSETDNEAKFEIIIDGLQVERSPIKLFKKYPENAVILDEIFLEQSINYAVVFRKGSNSSFSNSKTYRLHIKRLPFQIYHEKTKICVKIF